jgi:hypothetical protein
VYSDRVIAAGLFEPVKKANVVATVNIIVAAIMVYIYESQVVSSIYELYKLYFSLCLINTLAPYIPLGCRSYIINPKFDMSSLL